jgi:hypothetical protein
MHTLRNTAFSLLVALCPFWAGMAAFLHVHWHSHQGLPASPVAVADSCGCGHIHAHHESDDSSLPVKPGHDCKRCLLCHFASKVSWFEPIATATDAETIVVPVIQQPSGLIGQEIPDFYRGRAPPVAMAV